MMISSLKTKQHGFYVSSGYTLSAIYDHSRPQGRPHEKEFELFSNTKINVTKVGTKNEDEKMESGFHTSLDVVLKMSKIVFFSNFVLTSA